MMTNQGVAQLAAGLLAVTTPWIVVRIAFAVAASYVQGARGAVPPLERIGRLGKSTAVAAAIVAAFALLPVPPVWLAAIEGVLFAGLSVAALRLLGELDTATHAARQVDSAVRAAKLTARRHRHYMPTYLRVLPFGLTLAALALFGWRLTIPAAADRRVFLPIACALIASVFQWLYETWIHQLVTGPMVPDSSDSDRARRRSVRLVFMTECILVTSFLALAHGLLDLDWAASGAWAAILAVGGGVLGVIGCSLALSSDLMTRRYTVAPVMTRMEGSASSPGADETARRHRERAPIRSSALHPRGRSAARESM